jgi:uncharacterized iron-regulated membrane protein
MMKLRSVIFWLHLSCGVAAGVVILMMSVTGVLLTYQRQITAWTENRAFRIDPPAGARRLSLEALIACVHEAQPELAAATITVGADPYLPVIMAAGPGRTVYVDPYSGEVLGEAGGQAVRSFFRRVTDWHRWLATSIQARARGRAVTGASNLVFLFIVISGPFLWWPSAWNWRAVRNVTWFRSGLPGKARDFNWHNTIGFWSAIPLTVIVGSGVVMSYPWANNLVYRISGEAPPAANRGGEAQARQDRQGGEERRGRLERPRGHETSGWPDGLDALWAKAEQQMPEWRTISVRVPSGSRMPVVFTLDAGNGGQPSKRGTLTLNGRTGEVIRWDSFASMSPGRRVRSWLRFAHTGEVYGLAGQTIAGLVSAGGAVLVWTGLALAFRRFLSWRKRGTIARLSS